MEYIAHRINTVDELIKLPVEYGVELDLRDNVDGTIYIQHNPFEIGEPLSVYLQEYSMAGHTGTMILNIKSERIEIKALEMLRNYGINKYFFLDSTFPMIYLLSSQGEKNIALRYSEYEGLDTIRNMKNLVEWIWVDCFTKLPLDKKIETELHNMGYKICLVSPELEGRQLDLCNYKQKIESENILIDAICTKSYNIQNWKE